MTEETRKQLESWMDRNSPLWTRDAVLMVIIAAYELGEKAGRSAQRDAIVSAVPWLFEYGSHQHPHCYRGSDDGCYCGLDDAKKVVEAAIEAEGFRQHQEGQ